MILLTPTCVFDTRQPPNVGQVACGATLHEVSLHSVPPAILCAHALHLQHKPQPNSQEVIVTTTSEVCGHSIFELLLHF